MIITIAVYYSVLGIVIDIIFLIYEIYLIILLNLNY